MFDGGDRRTGKQAWRISIRVAMLNALEGCRWVASTTELEIFQSTILLYLENSGNNCETGGSENMQTMCLFICLFGMSCLVGEETALLSVNPTYTQ